MSTSCQPEGYQYFLLHEIGFEKKRKPMSPFRGHVLIESKGFSRNINSSVLQSRFLFFFFFFFHFFYTISRCRQ